jgi:carbamoyl-phosphate synthase large subunit
VIALLGAALVVIALIVRTFRALSAGRRLDAAFNDPDPVARATAVDVATADGIGRNIRSIVALAKRERDLRVLDAIASAVQRHAWEPADGSAIVELRLWAQRFERWRAQTDAASTPEPVAPATEVPVGAVEPVERGLRVLVTGAGGPAGISVIRALIDAGHEIVAADMDPLAAGGRLAHAFATVPSAGASDYVDAVLRIVDTYGVDALVPTITEEAITLAQHRGEVESRVAVWLPSLDALETCRDKWRFVNVMRDAGIRVPATTLPPTTPIPGPWIVKPRASRGSRGVTPVDRVEDLAAAIARVDDPIVQSRVSGREFTVDALVDTSGEVVAAVPRWRLETKAGISTKGRTFTDDRVVDGVCEVLCAVGRVGPANVQGFVDEQGEVTFIEVNPRFSGGLPLSLHAGADLVGEYLRAVMGRPIRPERLTFEPNKTMIRHFEELYA